MENQGKRKAWYQLKIQELEAKVAELSAQLTVSSLQPVTETSTYGDSESTVLNVSSSTSYSDAYADGYVDCMHKYGILSKVMRRRTHDLIKAKGTGAVKGAKRTRFSISVPSL
jgi:hypothetical protein